MAPCLTSTCTVMEAIELRSRHLLQPPREEPGDPDWGTMFSWLENVVKFSLVQVSSWGLSQEETEPFVTRLFRMDVVQKESLLTVAGKLSSWYEAWRMLTALKSIVKYICDSPHAQRYVPDDFMEAVGEVIDFSDASTDAAPWSDNDVREELGRLKDTLGRCKSLRLKAEARKPASMILCST